MDVGAGLYMYDVVEKFTFAISSPDDFLFQFTSSTVFFHYYSLCWVFHFPLYICYALFTRDDDRLV